MSIEAQIEEIIDRYVVDRPWARSDPGYQQRQLMLRFGNVDEDAIEMGLPGASVDARRELVAAVFREFAAEVLASVGPITA